MKKILAAATLFFLAYGPAWALEARVLVTGERNISDKWYKTAPESGLDFSSTKSVCRGQNYSILVFFSGYATSEDGAVDLVYDLRVEGPGHYAYIDQQGVLGARGKISNPQNVLLSRLYLSGFMEPEDPLGTYEITVAAHDNIAGKTAQAASSVELAAWKPQQAFADNAAVENWVMHYYRNPSPEKAVEAYLLFARSFVPKPDGFDKVFCFFREVFDANGFLKEPLLQAYQGQDMATRKSILYLFRHLDWDAAPFLQTLEGPERQAYHEMLGWDAFPVLDGRITTVAQLDRVWVSFLANGKIAPVQAVVDSLDTGGSFPAKDISKNNAQQDQEALNTLFQAALGSLVGNCQRHPLAAGYCEHLYKHGGLSQTQTLWLGIALAHVYPAKYQVTVSRDETAQKPETGEAAVQ